MNELRELLDRVAKLGTFIAHNPQFTKLASDEQERMRSQFGHMEAYARILKERVENF